MDDALLAAARQGDRDAVDALLREITPLVARRCRRILPFPQDAEEATQEALITIAAQLNGFRGSGSFEGWVSAIATNQARMTYRTLRRRSDERGVAELPEGADPARVSVIAGSRLDLLEALNDLEREHPETVQAFLLRDLGTLPYGEIAAELDVPLGTVKARIHTARRFLRPRLVEE